MKRVRPVPLGLAALAGVAAVVGLLLPASAVPAIVVNNAGAVHVAAFAVGTALWVVALPGRALRVVAAAVAVAAGSEVVQATLAAGRNAQWADVGSNLAGIAAGAVVGGAVSAAWSWLSRRSAR